ncbi:helix-turn-helix domain-containing protein [Elizabethkingia anophelis]|uniref:HTH cro/C1-type domain-containing protein n=1 Tax=Elizabethkingia anophelis TaxID=1117645 RepID=A0AAU8VB22_9FLAO|nr:helix-turn-helix transcriptional regulator [Elizabethkingia anophelis]AQX01473.1 hypothetical protein BBD32_08365 [Elizabethkingia anophelis]OPB62034.1 hypothetical protein BAY11_17015 [Elizabethkingia anophelis]
MESTLDTELLAGMLRSKRGNKGLRAVAEEIGSVSFTTLSRIEQGRIPDVDTFIRICNWLEVSTETFILFSSSTKTVSSKDRIVAHLRAEKELSKDHVNMILNMIDLAYNSK